MMMKDIPGWEKEYSITEDGRVWSKLNKKFRAPFDNGHGYLCIDLFSGGRKRQYRINRLVAMTYLGKPEEGQNIVGHKDDNPANNYYLNLFWTTQKENLDTEHFREKQKVKLFTKIRCVETGEIFESQAAAARWAGIHKYGINNVLHGKQKTAGGYHWERVEENRGAAND